MRRTFLISTLMIFFCLLSACNDGEKKEEKSSVGPASLIRLSKEQVKTSAISIGTAIKDTMSMVIASTGAVDVPPQYKASVSTSVGGFVKSTEVLEGDHVHAGEVLAVLSHPDYVELQQQFLEARSRYLLAAKQLNRQKELREDNINSQKKMEEAEADAKIAQAQMKALEAKLKMIGLNADKIAEGNISSTITIKSPITGDVAMVNTTLGKFAKPEEPMFEVISKDHLHLDLKVYEKDVLKVKEGQRVLYHVAGEEDQHNATIILAGKKLDPETRTVSIHAHPQNSQALLPGMYIKASILLQERSVSALPEEALVKEGDKEYIFVKSGEEKDAWLFKKIPVKTGVTENGLVEIISPELESWQDRIVLKGAYFINSQTAVQEEEEE